MANHKRHVQNKITSATARINYLRKQIESAMAEMNSMGCTFDLQLKIMDLTISFANSMYNMAVRANRLSDYSMLNVLKIFRELKDLRELEKAITDGDVVFKLHDQEAFFKMVSQTADNLSVAISGKTVSEMELPGDHSGS